VDQGPAVEQAMSPLRRKEDQVCLQEESERGQPLTPDITCARLLTLPPTAISSSRKTTHKAIRIICYAILSYPPPLPPPYAAGAPAAAANAMTVMMSHTIRMFRGVMYTVSRFITKPSSLFLHFTEEGLADV